MKIVKSIIIRDGENRDENIEIEIDEDTSNIKIGDIKWRLDTSNLKGICEDTLDIIKEHDDKFVEGS